MDDLARVGYHAKQYLLVILRFFPQPINHLMKKLPLVILIVIVVIILAISSHIFYLTTLSAREQYPEDSYLKTETNKVALIIVAHDDDMASSSGTISKLCSEGWEIREMCFYQQGGLYFKKDSAKNPVRKISLQEVANIQGLAGVDPVNFNFRRDMTTEMSYMPMPYGRMKDNYQIDSLNIYISRFIEKYKPSVIFTLDDKIGGYGHPDHVIVSKLVVDYCSIHKNDPGFPVKKIYQSVFAPSLAENIMGKLPVYIEAKKVYRCDGPPLPDVQVDIYSYAKQKKAVLSAYTTEQNSIRKFWPCYSYYPSWIYFKIFDRDFFRILDTEKL
jgi:LmbE family N-acetylglucosaminyl deacetylase